MAALVADILADGLDADQIDVLGSFITIIGDSLSFISAQMSLEEGREDSKCSEDSEDSKDPKASRSL
ncbi:MAG TPA: hypothetical protein VN381_05495 [Anaerovoracaceae bacterium]|nr:hypothetical protein [Anaerovoracaceae bacterium]